MAQSKLEQAKTALWNALVARNKTHTEGEVDPDDVELMWELSDNMNPATVDLVIEQLAAVLTKPAPKKPVTILVSAKDLKKIKDEAEDSCLTAACKASIKAATFNPRKPAKK